MTDSSVFHTLLTPPMPPMASDDIGGLGVLSAIRRNAFEAFPRRCWVDAITTLNTPLRPVVVATSPEAIRHIMLDAHQDYVRPSVGKRVLRPIAGEGLIVSEGAAWKRQRRTMAPAFSPQKILALSGLIRDVAERSCRKLEERRGQPEDLLSFFQAVSLDIGATVMFSTDISAIGVELRRLLTLYATQIGRPAVSDFLLPAWVPTLSTVHRALFRRNWRRLIEHAIVSRRSHRTSIAGEATESAMRGRFDLFDLLEQAHGDRADNLLADEVSTMLVAGHETTALTLFWASALLAHSPDIQSELATEAAAFEWLGTSGAASRDMDLTTLPLTRAVVQETLRLYSPAFLTARLARLTHQVCGHELSAGSMVLIPFWLLHRNPERWTSAASFDPWRFVNGVPPERFDYLPFGVGPHVCIGAQLAISEVVILLARLLRDNRIAPLKSDMPLPIGRLSTRPAYSPLFDISAR